MKSDKKSGSSLILFLAKLLIKTVYNIAWQTALCLLSGMTNTITSFLHQYHTQASSSYHNHHCSLSSFFIFPSQSNTLLMHRNILMQILFPLCLLGPKIQTGLGKETKFGNLKTLFEKCLEKINFYSTIFIVQPDVRARAEAKPIGTNQGMKYSVQRTNWVEGERKGPSNRNSHSELRIVGRTGGTHPEPP